jgi:enamine deaminase RidA (YjgF/YER057c/UK114 family)
VLVSAGVDFENVAQFTTFLTNSENIPDFYNVRNEVFNTVFPNGDYPPNTLLVINRLVREEFLIEIEAIAGLP